MIGVIANDSEHAAIAEFFELFKTPWEFYRDERTYDVVLSTLGENVAPRATKLTVFYSSHELPIDATENIQRSSADSQEILLYKESKVPIYGGCITFREEGTGLAADGDFQQAGIYVRHSKGGMVARVGYDIFDEVRTLLTSSQPFEYADIPTLELHIGLLRDLILASGAGLVEIPAVPAGYDFIACLTHDVDHPSIKIHKWDHTMFGFLYRAVFGSVRNLALGRMSARNLVRNWLAALKLPLVYMGLAKDFWSGFADHYLELEKGLPSTFFVIPFKDRPGRCREGMAPRIRAARYGANEIGDAIRKVMAAGCEVALHGIDAWLDTSSGREEIAEVRRLTNCSGIGVRMHWLYYDERSPAILEDAGAAYDSTVGYRETVGFPTGTTQCYKPLQASRLLELPLHAMDTALFYPAYRNLSQQEAIPVLKQMVDNVVKFGGCVTTNWHDRSLFPERAWDTCYRNLIEDLKKRGAWFATAGQATAWFRKRRSARFNSDRNSASRASALVSIDSEESVPGLRLRIYKARESRDIGEYSSELRADAAFSESLNECPPTEWQVEYASA